MRIILRGMNRISRITTRGAPFEKQPGLAKEAGIQGRVEKLGTSNTHNTTLSIEYRFFFRRGTEIPEEPADGLSPILLKYHIGPP